ncbi:hypothetical protein [Caballeronia sp. 15711]|uniref:hypothetical protein n=1 Tax=Caballeronia sp. 15711 TaxID=3391029 RepID=UPI0039E68058
MNHAMHVGLDHPIWAALTTRQAHLGLGESFARRYHPDVAPFAALAPETPAAYRAPHALLLPGEQVVLQSFDAMAPADALQMTHVGIASSIKWSLRTWRPGTWTLRK